MLPTQKAEFLQKSFLQNISNQFQKLFKSALWYCFKIKLFKFFSTISLSFWIYMKHLFMFNISFKSHLIRYSGTGRAFKDIQRALEHLRHSEDTERALGHSEGTWSLRNSEGIRALEHLRYLGTRTRMAIRHLGTWALFFFFCIKHLHVKHKKYSHQVYI